MGEEGEEAVRGSKGQPMGISSYIHNALLGMTVWGMGEILTALSDQNDHDLIL